MVSCPLPDGVLSTTPDDALAPPDDALSPPDAVVYTPNDYDIYLFIHYLLFIYYLVLVVSCAPLMISCPHNPNPNPNPIHSRRLLAYEHGSTQLAV